MSPPKSRANILNLGRKARVSITIILGVLQVQVRAEGLGQIQDHAPVRHNGQPLPLVQGREAEAAGRFIESRVNFFSRRADRTLQIQLRVVFSSYSPARRVTIIRNRLSLFDFLHSFEVTCSV